MMGDLGRILRVGGLMLVVMLGTSGTSMALGSTQTAEATSSENVSTPQVKSEEARRGALAFECAIGGGGLLPWTAPEEAGNGFGASASLVWSDFRAGLAYGVAFPDSFSQGLYHNVWAEFTWYALGTIGSSHVRPYLLVGAGVALADEPPEIRIGDPETTRWNEESSFLGMVAVGARYGLDRGLYVAVDLRAYNHTFGGYNLFAGYTF